MTEQTISETEVAAWLRENPDIFDRRPELFTALKVQHKAGTASLIEKQVDLLREENLRLKRQLEHLSTVAGENERLMQRLHGLALELVAADSRDALYQRLQEGLHRDFHADAVCLMLDDVQHANFADAGIARLPESRPEWLQRLLTSGTPQCGRLTREKRDAVFGDRGDEIGSAALVPLGEDGLLAIGAKSDGRFHPDMGTLFLELLRETLRFRLDMHDRSEDKQRQRA